MKKLLMLIPLVILLCFTFGCQKQGEEVAEEAKPDVDIAADVEAIKACYDQKTDALKAGDTDRWIALFTEDIIFMPPNEAIAKGKDAIRQWVQPYFDQFDMDEAYSFDEIEVSGNWAFARVTGPFKFTPKAGGETIQQVSKSIWIFKRQADGSWKGSHCIWNSNNPPPQAPTEK